MPHNCVVEGCNNRSSKEECENLSFHQLPLMDAHLLQQWTIKARLPQKLVNKHSRVCGAHFIGGKRSNANNVPQLFPWTPSRRPPPSRTLHLSPLCRPPASRILLAPHSCNLPPCPTPSSTLQPFPTPSNTLLPSAIVLVECPDPTGCVEHDHSYCKSRQQELEKLSVVGANKAVQLAGDDTADDNALLGRTNVATQCVSFLYVSSSVQCSLLEKSFGISQFHNDNAAIHFYTGFPDYRTFIACFEFLGNAVNHLNYWYGGKTKETPPNNKGAPRALTPLNEYFLVLCRLRLGLLEQDIAYRFHVSQPTVCRICVTWINFMYVKLKEIPIWPTRASIDKLMPRCFKENYTSTRCIVDAMEIFIQQPSSTVAQQLTFSSYKNHNTVKAIVGITPSGAICFISKLFGDLYLTGNLQFSVES